MDDNLLLNINDKIKESFKKINEKIVKKRKSSMEKTKMNVFNEQNIVCKNCNKEGHRIRDCKEPIKSYGIICYTIKGSKIYYLMINRNNSISFVDFIYGKYDTYNLKYLKKLFVNMCYREKEYIKNKTFDELWGLLGSYNNYRYERAKKKFELLHVLINNKTKRTYFEELLNTTAKYKDTEWVFPKGRKLIEEDPFECAKREFQEETDIDINKLNIDKTKVYIEKYKAINGVEYETIFYLAQSNEKLKLSINKKNKNQIKEVRDIQWNTYLQSIHKIRYYHKSRIEILKKINKELIQQHF